MKNMNSFLVIIVKFIQIKFFLFQYALVFDSYKKWAGLTRLDSYSPLLVFDVDTFQVTRIIDTTLFSFLSHSNSQSPSQNQSQSQLRVYRLAFKAQEEIHKTQINL